MNNNYQYNNGNFFPQNNENYFQQDGYYNQFPAPGINGENFVNPNYFPMNVMEYQPIVIELPPQTEGYHWELRTVMNEVFSPLPDGSWGSHWIPNWFYEEVRDPIAINPQNIAQVVTASSEEQKTPPEQTAEKIEILYSDILKSNSKNADINLPDSTIITDITEELGENKEGEYGDAGTIMLNPASLNLSSLSEHENNLMEQLISPLANRASVNSGGSDVNRDNALRNYKQNYRYGIHQGTNLSKTYPFRNGKLLNYTEPHRDFFHWEEAATHELPLEIIDNLEQLVQYKDIYKNNEEDCFTFQIPCSAKSIGTFAYEKKYAIIEFTIAPNGKPTHYFLKTFDHRTEEYKKKYLDDKLSNFTDDAKNLEYPALGKAKQFKKVKGIPTKNKPSDDGLCISFLSKHDLLIKIPKAI
jgi:hypothetical protein